MAEQRALHPDDFKLSEKYRVQKRKEDTTFRLLQYVEEKEVTMRMEVFDEDRNQKVHLTVFSNQKSEAAKTVTFRKGLLIVAPEDVQTLNYLINSPENRDSPFRAAYNRKAVWVELDIAFEGLEQDRKYKIESLAREIIGRFTVSQAQHTLKKEFGFNVDGNKKLIDLHQMLHNAVAKDYFSFVNQNATNTADILLTTIIHAHNTGTLKYHKSKWYLNTNGEYITTVSLDEYADEALLNFLTEPKTFPNPKDKENYEALVAKFMKDIGYSKPETVVAKTAPDGASEIKKK